MIFDVAIAGGGPAGGWLARELARAGKSIVLLERSKVAGEPNFSSAGTTFETLICRRSPSRPPGTNL